MTPEKTGWKRILWKDNLKSTYSRTSDMPRYTYACPAGHRTETIKPRDARTIRCGCGKKAERVISPPAVHFKGGGFTRKSA